MVRPWRQAAGSTRTSDRHPSPPFPFPLPSPSPSLSPSPPFPSLPSLSQPPPSPFLAAWHGGGRRRPGAVRGPTRGSARADPGPCTPEGPACRTYKYTDLHAEIQPEKQTEAARSSSPVYCFHCTQYYQPLFCFLSNILKQTILLAIVMLIVEYCFEANSIVDHCFDHCCILF